MKKQSPQNIIRELSEEALVLHERIFQLEERERKSRSGLLLDLDTPNAVNIACIEGQVVACSVVETARRLGHFVVVNAAEGNQLLFFATKMPAAD